MNQIIKTILVFLTLLILVIAAVAGAIHATEGDVSADPIQRINGGAK